MCSVVRVMSVENVYIFTCTQTYCMNWDWLEWKANMARVKLQLVMMSVYVYCVIQVITSYAHQFQAPYVMHAWWSNTFRYLHIWCILIKINMLTGIVASCINPIICFMSIHTLFRMYFHYHHYNILYQNIITAKISREHTWHRNATLSLRLTTQGANVRGGPFSDPHQFTHFTDIL